MFVFCTLYIPTLNEFGLTLLANAIVPVNANTANVLNSFFIILSNFLLFLDSKLVQFLTPEKLFYASGHFSILNGKNDVCFVIALNNRYKNCSQSCISCYKNFRKSKTLQKMMEILLEVSYRVRHSHLSFGENALW